MKRRDFLVQSIEASLLTYLGGGVALGARAKTRADKGAKNRAARGAGKVRVATEPVPDHVAALNPVSTYIRSYIPPDGSLDPTQVQTLSFDILGWGTGQDRQRVSTPILGQVTVRRNPSSESVEYDVRQQLGKLEVMTGRFQCRTDRWHSLEGWQYKYELTAGQEDIDRLSFSKQSGKDAGETVTIETDGARSVTKISTPLLCRYGILDITGRLNEFCEARNSFAMLLEPSGLRPGQRFRQDVRDVVRGRRELPIQTILQTGPATVPTHWIVDEQGRPLFITAFLTSWALKSIV